MTTPRVLIIEDHSITRLGLRIMLTEHFGNPIHVIETDKEKEALETLQAGRVDFCTLDLKMPGVDPVGLIKKLKDIQPDIKILVISMNNETLYSQSVISAGARGFVSKESGYDNINKAISVVKSGRTYLSEQLISHLISNSNKPAKENPILKLSNRELQIVQLLLDGQNTKSISNTLNLGLSTVSTFKGRIFEKLNISSLIELYDLARTMPSEALNQPKEKEKDE